MRMTSMIIGGIIGASVATYMIRNNMTMKQTLSKAGSVVNKLINPNTVEQMATMFQENKNGADSLASTYQMQ